ncbi:uncharacterized protein JN550_000800 [Neoarthrinium moseri]|uniref:uncharacterized protein n=1 Tax=Neoarthrinium moseri TaxID=1658444 RepID=UPI001FDB345D|nr:uncharacterized protein JN550_000800 [Neoarthrinium moseri]KAI1876728.1 hypothetical protein JN550_000800 [Neoarthrinium moseri]
MTATLIRPRQASDIPALVEALQDVYNSDGYPVEGTSTALTFLSPPGLLEAWVAVQEGVVVGHIVVIAGEKGNQAPVQAWTEFGEGGKVEQTVVVARFFVRELARGTGLGRGLVDATCAWAKENDMRIVMNVLSHNVGAMKLYEKAGFRIIGKGIHVNPQGQRFPQYFYVYG